jgi:hypothetical protein
VKNYLSILQWISENLISCQLGTDRRSRAGKPAGEMNQEPLLMSYHLAQLNIARMKYSWGSKEMDYFNQQLGPVNAVADQSPGFVWRLESEEGNAIEYQIFEGPGYLVNMSLWESLEYLNQFVRAEIHMDVMKRRSQWFEKMESASMVLWWVPVGHRPDVAEAQERLEYLRSHGSSERAFTFISPFDSPGSPVSVPIFNRLLSN